MTPGPTSQKNLAISPAASDLGLGDSLQQQLQDQLAERRKIQASKNGSVPGANLFPSSVSDLLGQFSLGT